MSSTALRTRFYYHEKLILDRTEENVDEFVKSTLPQEFIYTPNNEERWLCRIMFRHTDENTVYLFVNVIDKSPEKPQTL